MAIKYIGLSEINGPLVMLDKVSGIRYAKTCKSC